MENQKTCLRLPAGYYRQFDANLTLDVPAEGFDGWTTVPVELPLAKTALVSMHAWQFGTPEQFPGLYRQIEYIDRAGMIMEEVYPPILAAARAAGMPVLHVAAGGDYFKRLPGHLEVLELAGEEPAKPPGPECDPTLERLQEVRAHPGRHNAEDYRIGHESVDFPAPARPLDGEPISETTHQLNAVCRARGISHLVYMGVAINWCLLMSPAGMIDMSRLGYMCSAIRQATTAVENKETARQELCKEIGLWRVSRAFGFVFDADDMTTALAAAGA